MNQMIENKQPLSNRQILTNSENSNMNSQNLLLTNKEMHVAPVLPYCYFAYRVVDTCILFMIILGAKAYLPVQMNVFEGRFSLVSH